jgi:hypothetical protein
MKLKYFQVIHEVIIYMIMKTDFGGKNYND